MLIVCIKEFYFINIEFCFKVKRAVNSQDDGCPLLAIVPAEEHERGFWVLVPSGFGTVRMVCSAPAPGSQNIYTFLHINGTLV